MSPLVFPYSFHDISGDNTKTRRSHVLSGNFDLSDFIQNGTQPKNDLLNVMDPLCLNRNTAIDYLQ